MPRSNPFFEVSYNLRNYSVERRHLPQERAPRARVMPLDSTDLLGGRGRWRQRRALVEFERRSVEEEEHKRQQKKKGEDLRRKKAEKEARRRRQAAEEDRRRTEERERQLREKEEIDRQRKELAEIERLRLEEEERQRLARLPKSCDKCGGTGKCPKCLGKGFGFALFLAAKVMDGSSMGYGRTLQGCFDCGGFEHGIRGEMQKGTGLCANCGGAGQTMPTCPRRAWGEASHATTRLSREPTGPAQQYTNEISLTAHPEVAVQASALAPAVASTASVTAAAAGAAVPAATVPASSFEPLLEEQATIAPTPFRPLIEEQIF